MQRLWTVRILVIFYAVVGAASVVLAIIQLDTSPREAGTAVPGYVLLVTLGALLVVIAVLGFFVSIVMKDQAERIEAMERRLSQAPGVPSELVRT